MTNFYFNFNGSFGIDAISNQHRTNIESTSSQCRANVEPTSRDKLFLPRLWKHVAMIFAVLTLSIANIGTAWGADYVVVADWRTAGVNTLTPAIGTTSDVVTFSPISKGNTLSSATVTSSGKSLTGIYINNNYSSNGGDFIDIRVPAGYKIKSVDSIYVSHTGTFSSKKGVYMCYAGSQLLALNAKSTSPGTEIQYNIPNVGTGYQTVAAAGFAPAFASGSAITAADSLRCIRIYKKSSSGQSHYIQRLRVTVSTVAAASDSYDIHIGKNNANYSDESLTNTSGSTWSKNITLDAGSYYEFKVKKTPTAGDAVWYGNNGSITASVASWTFSTSENNCKLYTTVAGSYTFSWDASNNQLSVTYPVGDHPTKRIYMACGSTWCNDSPKFFVHSWGVSEYNTQVQQNACGDYYADIIWYNDYFQFTRNASNATAYNDNNWNYSQDLTYDSSKPLWTCTGYSDNKGNFSSSAYSPTTYTISYNKGTNGTGSKANESKTCGVDFTLPGSTFTYGGHTQDGWATSDNGAIAYALSCAAFVV